MNTYSTSDGERFTESQIKAKIREAKAKALQKQIDEYGYNFCEEGQCGKNANGTYLDCSHDYSVGQSKKDGKVEQSWNVKNIVIRCRKLPSKKGWIRFTI